MTPQIGKPRAKDPYRTAHRRSSITRAVAVAMFSVLALATAACSSGNPPVVFTSDRDGNLEIYAVSVETGAEQNLTESPRDEFEPVVSRDGKLIAFRSGPESNSALETMAVNGASRQQLVNGMGKYRSQRWSPNEKRLAFIRELSDRPNLYVMNSDGTESMSLTSIPADEIGSWSPDGKSVLFSVSGGPQQGIYVRNPDGVNEFRLTDTPDHSPLWSPDGRMIAFISTRDDNPELYTMNADGTDQRRATNSPQVEHSLSWSPDSMRLLFVSEQDRRAEIFTTDTEGSVLNQLTHNDVRDDEPVWSPDGGRIAFVSFLDGDSEIFVMDSDGSNQIRLTNNAYNDVNPSW